MNIDENAEKHWRLETDADNIAWLWFDKAGTGTNVLSGEVLYQLNDILAELEKNPPRAVAVCSAKKSGFIAGADIKEFVVLETPDQAYELIRHGQRVMDRLEALPCPTIAAINGFALGGGLELALACTYRIVVDDDSARLGLPEVKLGIHPGFGGTVRTTQLVDPLAAMDMMLTGRGLRPRKAKAIGLVDQVVPARHLLRATRMLALNPPKRKGRNVKAKALSFGPSRALLARQMEKKVAQKAKKEHYPAPYAIIDLWKKHADNPAEMYEAEARSIAELMCTSTSRNLVRVFNLQDRLKGLARKARFRASHVHVIGAGVMGGDIAAWCAMRGLNVTLQDREPKYIAPAIGRAHKLYKKRLRRPAKIQAAMDRLMPDPDGDGVRHADVVIEAIFENVEAKHELYRSVEPRMKPGAILATNTSSIRLETLGAGLADPDRLIGLHFFNPVPMMPLVEVIHTDRTHEQEVSKGLAFARQIDRLPLPCKSAPGFVVNRVLMPYMIEAVRVAEEGVALPLIDKAATDFGMPMGPVELADTVGLDVAASVAKVFEAEFGMPMPAALTSKVEAGELGRKSGKGFYEWSKGKAVKPQADADDMPANLQDRLLLPLINESVACLREGVVTDADLLDAGVIFGTGFAPFRGGPLHYAASRGEQEIVAVLRGLAAQYGDRFEPDSGWDNAGQESSAA
ncbi:MAG: enoyl-CoA hydratase/isomerase family protein [Gammaproteobacteria bacterium]|nr:enoyl-CoA hydratase/isomerase family protein [Gammaproteobacteria bacterium]NNF61822.1 crotonase [Gammaproteobacteria bacterium]NNM19746.1 crotonase [Gammaproteobacteria bacterium]